MYKHIDQTTLWSAQNNDLRYSTLRFQLFWFENKRMHSKEQMQKEQRHYEREIAIINICEFGPT